MLHNTIIPVRKSRCEYNVIFLETLQYMHLFIDAINDLPSMMPNDSLGQFELYSSFFVLRLDSKSLTS